MLIVDCEESMKSLVSKAHIIIMKLSDVLDYCYIYSQPADPKSAGLYGTHSENFPPDTYTFLLFHEHIVFLFNPTPAVMKSGQQWCFPLTLDLHINFSGRARLADGLLSGPFDLTINKKQTSPQVCIKQPSSIGHPSDVVGYNSNQLHPRSLAQELQNGVGNFTGHHSNSRASSLHRELNLDPPPSLPTRSGGRTPRHRQGGHTMEILRLLSSLSQSYSPIHYVLAESDKMSEEKIRSFEQKRAELLSNSSFTLHRIPRSREVHQSWSSSVLTTLQSMLYSLPLAFRLKPDLVLCNGPGTCVPICISSLLLRMLGLKRVTIVYVESICRVENLSLSGKILYYFSDYFIVQWPALKEKYPKSLYLGRIV
ncbi:hypothetical protein EYD10_10246 [Varanus komodoensis]|nr:hypothetical protein EYD10_10246 [Varanus komodoensis]